MTSYHDDRTNENGMVPDGRSLKLLSGLGVNHDGR